MTTGKKGYLNKTIEHISMETSEIEELVESYGSMAFQSRNLYNSARIYVDMLADRDCAVVATLAGSIFSAGLKRILFEMVHNNMVDIIVSSGDLIVDQDFFEALGYRHYMGDVAVDDEALRKSHVDRIYDTYIDEDELRVCDETITKIADSLEPKPYSSREFIKEMGRYLDKNAKHRESVVLEAYKKNVPIFVPAFSDCSAGFGLVMHQSKRPQKHVSIDSAKDFLELTKLKMAVKDTGLFMIGGGVPKNFAQDTVVAAEVLGKEVPMHKYAVQITTADERDGGCSGSTLKEAHSWGKVDDKRTQMLYAEATLVVPIIASYAYKKGAWKNRTGMNLASRL